MGTVVNQQDIIGFLRKVYSDDQEPLHMENEQLAELRAFVAGLDESKRYALVAQES